jgi:hypothetical protein
MYSILIKDTDTSFHYLLGDDEARWSGTKEEAQAKVAVLLKQFTINRLEVVHNVTITSEITLADVGE